MAATRPVRVFKNHKLGCFTVLRGSTVVASARQVHLEDVEFLVRPSGRQRMLDIGRRTIHAYAVGTLVDFVPLGQERELVPFFGRTADYDPRRFSHFFDTQSQTLLSGAGSVRLDERAMFYADGRFIESALAA